ncbi:lysostaphin resistance A-like protein [Neisseria sp. CCUG12390]|uniref:CPBP family intramembrane glutamic endopeptidase n=1 Tax=Neisseria sp. CCUG12390 TaxID=3392035 RepID=UPI003A0FBD9A
MTWLRCFLYFLSIQFLSGMVFGFAAANAEKGSVPPDAVIFQLFFYGLCLWLVLWAMSRDYRRTLPDGRLPAPFFTARKVWISAAYLVLLLLGQAFYSQILSWLFGIPDMPTRNQQVLMSMVAHLPLPVTALLVLVGAPLGEELLFRGLLFRLLGAWRSRGRQVAALLASSVLFGLAHARIDDPALLVYVLMGMAFGLVYLHTRDLRYAVAVHFLNNAWALYAMLYLE